MLALSPEVSSALASGLPVVALESTLIAHGLPWPANLETARDAETIVRKAGAIPATIAVCHGTPTIGLNSTQIEELAHADGVFKASRRDLGAAVALKRLAATTVSATMALAHAAGIRVFATGGIGGAHRSAGFPGDPFDVSADLTELARTPVLVVCAGAKSILDLPRTLEILETLSVPVMGFRTHEFPAFYVASTNPPLPVPARVDSPREAAELFAAHTRLGGRGALLAQTCPSEVAISTEEFNSMLRIAEQEAKAQAIDGPRLTPFFLKRLAGLSNGRTLEANRVLIANNARLAAEVAKELAKPI